MSLHSVLQMRYISPLCSYTGPRCYFTHVSSAMALLNITENSSQLQTLYRHLLEISGSHRGFD